MARKNEWLAQPPRRLLQYRGDSRSYRPEEMFAALINCSEEEVGGLSKEEYETFQAFVEEVRHERDIAWLRRFFRKQQDKPFRLQDITAWAADNTDCGKDPAHIVVYFQVLLAAYAEKGFIERLQGMPPGRYRVAIVENTPLIDVGDPETEV